MMYKPAAKRRWGCFALPVLYGDRLPDRRYFMTRATSV